MSSIQQAYNSWASQYDTNQNKTRDLEAQSLRETLNKIDFGSCLEIGCGTGKNTVWLAEKADQLLSVDFSEEMLAKAKEKINSPQVQFVQADITKDWVFTNQQYDLVSFSLVLEHIEKLDHIFEQVSQSLKIGGHVYIGELHPFKQYAGSKARFETEQGTEVLDCFTHHISDFIQSAKKHGLVPVDIREYFDGNNQNEIPRILTILLQKPMPI
jgi:ubiquinone/menaquinone biosynthesis C-methylase UbiE